MGVLVSSMAMSVVPAATVTVAMPSAAVLEDENPDKVDEEAKDGHHEEPLVFHLGHILVWRYMFKSWAAMSYLSPLEVLRASRRLRWIWRRRWTEGRVR